MVDWLNQYSGIDFSGVPVYAHATPQNVFGAVVYGALPINLASLTSEVWVVDMDLPAHVRGHELTAEEINNYGARLVGYFVTKLGE